MEGRQPAHKTNNVVTTAKEVRVAEVAGAGKLLTPSGVGWEPCWGGLPDLFICSDPKTGLVVRSISRRSGTH